MFYRLEKYLNGEIFITTITSKSHVFPLNLLKASHNNSIPRLELVGAEKGVQLHTFVNGAVEVPFQRTVMWFNSEVVLYTTKQKSTDHSVTIVSHLLSLSSLVSRLSSRLVSSLVSRLVSHLSSLVSKQKSTDHSLTTVNHQSSIVSSLSSLVNRLSILHTREFYEHTSHLRQGSPHV